jgi:hypothetical protein
LKSFTLLTSYFSLRASQSFLCPHLYYDAGENGDKLIALINVGLEPGGIKQLGCRDQTEPVVRFAGFLAGNAVFAHEVRLALRGLSFLNICPDLGRRAQELVRERARRPRGAVQMLTQSHNLFRKLKRPARQITFHVLSHPFFFSTFNLPTSNFKFPFSLRVSNFPHEKLEI